MRSERNPVAEENIRAVEQIQNNAAQRLTAGERFGDRIARLAAHPWTVPLHVAVFVLWIAVSFPFELLTAAVSLEAIFLSLFVLASQNRMMKDAERRAHLDLQVNLLAEQEMTVVLQMLKEICEHLGLRHTIESQKFSELAKRTDITDLSDRLEQTIGVGQPKPTT